MKYLGKVTCFALGGLFSILSIGNNVQAQITTTSTDLPPDGVYVSPTDFHEYAAAGIIIDDPSHDRFLNPVIEVLGLDEVESFESSFNGTEIGLGLGAFTLNGPVQIITYGIGADPLDRTGTWSTEMVSMNLSGTIGGNVIQVRESPSIPSTGSVTITDIGGGLYQIDSFFDIFTEISVNGGPWEPSLNSTNMSLEPDPTPTGGIVTTTTDLPPDGEYVAPSDYHKYLAAGIVIDDPSHKKFTQVNVGAVPGTNSELESFQSTFTGVEIGQNYGTVSLSGPVQVRTDGIGGSPTRTGTWDTEIVSMNLSGDVGIHTIEIRESPGLPSIGMVKITDIGGGEFQIDSFFDVFTEISVDGGPFIPSDGSTRMALRETTGIITTDTNLPPDGEYISPTDFHMYADMGIVIDDPSHSGFTQVDIKRNGDNEVETFESTFSGTELEMGLGAIDLSGPVTVVTTGIGAAPPANRTGSWDTEMVSMSLSGEVGGSIVDIRESPTKPSAGKTTITDIGGGLYQIDSFFDVFTEISIDGGPWSPAAAPTRMTLRPNPAGGIITNTTDLPPAGEYIAPSDFHKYADLGIIIDDPSHYGFTQTHVTPEGPDEIESFQSTFTGTEIGQGYGDLALNGPVTAVTFGIAGSTARTGSWQTEILSMDLSGVSPTIGIINIRENPQIPSSGTVTITDIGGGLYQIDSFFDVFTEISVNGGPFFPSDGPTRMQLSEIAPPPCVNPPVADINGDCCVDLKDFRLLSAEWLTCGFGALFP